MRDLRVGGRTIPGPPWTVPECRAGCTVQYRFALRDACDGIDSTDTARRWGDVLEAPPSTWLVRPRGRAGARIDVTVRTSEKMQFAVGIPATGEGSFSFAAEEIDHTPYAAFGPLRIEERRVRDRTLRIALAPGRSGEDDLLRWIGVQASAVAAYFGHLPIDQTLVLVLPVRGDEVHGRTLGGAGGATILYWLPAHVDLQRDWVLVHEMVHTSLPTLPWAQHWAEEGLATYLEPIIRARAGLLASERVWRDMVLGLPQGQPREGDEGLDVTHTWGRTYWGGAMFWFLADIGIRERTRNARSLDDALRGLQAAGGTMAQRWPFARVLEVADRAAQVRTLEDLYRDMAHAPAPQDLDGLFSRLGVSLQGRRVALDDSAPLTQIRRAIAGR